jgi:hypothetical protein
LVADGELRVGDEVGFPDCVAGWVAVPLGVFDGRVADVVEFVGGVFEMDVGILSADCAVDFIGCVFDFPEPLRG